MLLIFHAGMRQMPRKSVSKRRHVDRWTGVNDNEILVTCLSLSDAVQCEDCQLGAKCRVNGIRGDSFKNDFLNSEDGVISANVESHHLNVPF